MRPPLFDYIWKKLLCGLYPPKPPDCHVCSCCKGEHHDYQQHLLGSSGVERHIARPDNRRQTYTHRSPQAVVFGDEVGNRW